MQQIIKHEQCQRCRECCRFRENRQYFAPVFTGEERDAVQAAAPHILTQFIPIAPDLYQIQLVRAKVDDGVYPYVCPYLDEDAYACSVYEVRPFDCRIWPMIVMRIRETGKIMLGHFTGGVCLGLKEVPEADFALYKEQFTQYARTEKFVAFLKAHPRLIWDHQAEDGYVTVSIDDLTAILGTQDEPT